MNRVIICFLLILQLFSLNLFSGNRLLGPALPAISAIAIAFGPGRQVDLKEHSADIYTHKTPGGAGQGAGGGLNAFRQDGLGSGFGGGSGDFSGGGPGSGGGAGGSGDGDDKKAPVAKRKRKAMGPRELQTQINRLRAELEDRIEALRYLGDAERRDALGRFYGHLVRRLASTEALLVALETPLEHISAGLLLLSKILREDTAAVSNAALLVAAQKDASQEREAERLKVCYDMMNVIPREGADDALERIRERTREMVRLFFEAAEREAMARILAEGIVAGNFENILYPAPSGAEAAAEESDEEEPAPQRRRRMGATQETLTVALDEFAVLHDRVLAETNRLMPSDRSAARNLPIYPIPRQLAEWQRQVREVIENRADVARLGENIRSVNEFVKNLETYSSKLEAYSRGKAVSFRR